jgi:hypothetical protein
MSNDVMARPATRDLADQDTARPDATRLQPATARNAKDDGVTVFTSQRPSLFKIATRILGDTSEAEDIVQEVRLRWRRTKRDEIENPPAILATATTQVAINVPPSAHCRRETSVTPWLDDMTEVGRSCTCRPSLNTESSSVASSRTSVLKGRSAPHRTTGEALCWTLWSMHGRGHGSRHSTGQSTRSGAARP